MVDNNINNPKSPKYYIKKYLFAHKAQLKDKIVLDIPAGNGATSEILHELGSKVESFDLFPEYFMVKDIECKRANLLEKLPVSDCYADLVICQEGIEHISDQLKLFKEFNRIVKKGGQLLLTTPNYSNLKSKLSYTLFETEVFNKEMPPNELDSVWMSDNIHTKEIYYGHIFLIGIQKLRVLGKLSGFSIHEILFTRVNKTSFFLFPFIYPLIVLSSLLTYLKAMKKNSGISKEIKKKTYSEILGLNLRCSILLDKHLFIIFKKEIEIKEVNLGLVGNFKSFNKIM
jgi:SAM-dependent methyltransferase